MKIKTFVFILIFLVPTAVFSQRLVSFYASDSVEVFADLYVKNPSRPYVIMAHAPNASRGEFNNIAEKFLNLNYNCLAVDLRNGQKINYIPNLTVKNNPSLTVKDNFQDLSKDMVAAIDYIYQKSRQPVILSGSLVAGSVQLILARNNPRVKAVLAFSPGEYLRPTLSVKEGLVAYDKPVCVLAAEEEKVFIDEMLQPIASSLKTTVYYPADQGYRGAALLWETNSTSEKFWFDLLLFFNQLDNE